MPPTETAIRALQYILNTAGCATKTNFIDDWEPIGPLLWDEIREFVTEDEHERLLLNKEGMKRIEVKDE
jgi:predicted ThiF/HesA family dinucleotide-utilizing enzyme